MSWMDRLGKKKEEQKNLHRFKTKKKRTGSHSTEAYVMSILTISENLVLPEGIKYTKRY